MIGLVDMMGEYAWHCGESIKIGTCQNMYYLRLEDRHLISRDENSIDVKNRDGDGLNFRLPFPDEDCLGPGRYDVHDRGVRLCLIHDPCVKNNCNSVDFDLVRIKKKDNKLYPVITCRNCGVSYSCEWKYIWWYVLGSKIDKKLLKRLKDYKNVEFCL